MKISNVQELEDAILELERKRVLQQKLMTAEFKSTVESLKPMNILKSTARDINTHQLARTVIKAAGGIGMGLLTSKLAGATLLRSAKPQSMIGGLLKSTLSAAVVSNADKIRAYSNAIIKNVFGNKKNTVL